MKSKKAKTKATAFAACVVLLVAMAGVVGTSEHGDLVDLSGPILTNPLINPGFECGLFGWSSTGGTATYSADSTNPHTGIYSAKGIETNKENLGRLYQDFTGKLIPGKEYKIGGWIKAENVEGQVVIGLNYVNSDGWSTADGYVKEIGYVSGTTGWTYYESDWFTLPQMPDDCSMLWFLFDFNYGKGTAWWDDVSLFRPCLADTAVYKAGVPDPEGILNPLRELRDDNLKEEYVDRYYDYSHELTMVVTRDPALAHEAARLLVKYSPMVKQEVYGIGMDKLITRGDVHEIVSFTHRLKSGVWKNRKDIGTERSQEIIKFLDEFKGQVNAAEGKTFSEALQGSIYCEGEQMPDPEDEFKGQVNASEGKTYCEDEQMPDPEG